MMGRILAWTFVGAVALALVGCSCGGGSSGDGVPSEVNDELSKMNQIAHDVNGDYKKLTAEQKQELLKLANNDPKQAADMLNRMAHPPTGIPHKKG
jgi:hypothetical protein